MAARQRSSGAQALAQEMGIASLLQKSESGLSTISEVFRRNFSQTMDQVEQELHSVIDPSGDPYPDPMRRPHAPTPLNTPLTTPSYPLITPLPLGAVLDQPQTLALRTAPLRRLPAPRHRARPAAISTR